MDINLIESTFNELMQELEKIKDLNELADSYKQKTQILSEQLERFLLAANKGNNSLMEKIEIIENALKEIKDHSIAGLQNSISDSIHGLMTNSNDHHESMSIELNKMISSLSEVRQRSEHLSEQIHSFESCNAKKLSDILTSTGNLNCQMKDFYSGIKELQGALSIQASNNEISTKQNRTLHYIQITLLVIITVLITILIFGK